MAIRRSGFDQILCIKSPCTAPLQIAQIKRLLASSTIPASWRAPCSISVGHNCSQEGVRDRYCFASVIYTASTFVPLFCYTCCNFQPALWNDAVLGTFFDRPDSVQDKPINFKEYPPLFFAPQLLNRRSPSCTIKSPTRWSNQAISIGSTSQRTSSK